MIAGPYVATLTSRNRADSPLGGRRDGTVDARDLPARHRIPSAIPETCLPGEGGLCRVKADLTASPHRPVSSGAG